MKRIIVNLVLGALVSTLVMPLCAHAQTKIVRVQTAKDAWQIRMAQTQVIIRTISDPNATQAQHTEAMDEFDARLTASEKGKLTPIETMQLLGIFYVPRELEHKPPPIETLLKVIATQATLGWYDALRFADASGRAEIVDNQAFFTLALGQSAPVFIQFMKDHPDQAEAAVNAGI